ncbi:hypothetical protein ACOMHN_035650 [Nucella lapillus]
MEIGPDEIYYSEDECQPSSQPHMPAWPTTDSEKRECETMGSGYTSNNGQVTTHFIQGIEIGPDEVYYSEDECQTPSQPHIPAWPTDSEKSEGETMGYGYTSNNGQVTHFIQGIEIGPDEIYYSEDESQLSSEPHIPAWPNTDSESSGGKTMDSGYTSNSEQMMGHFILGVEIGPGEVYYSEDECQPSSEPHMPEPEYVISDSDSDVLIMGFGSGGSSVKPSEEPRDGDDADHGGWIN